MPISTPFGTVNGKITATATCPRCGWSATMRGDSEIEIATFLRVRVLEHAAVHEKVS